MKSNDDLKLHFVNVNHGDATILELPDRAGRARFGVVDFGAKRAADRGNPRDYLHELIALRRDGDADLDYVIEFACVTHPHNDHYGGLSRFIAEFGPRGASFWDCGFRTTSIEYNRILDDHVLDNDLTFIRLGSGSEFEFGGVRVTVLAPSVDLRNRFDTYGIGKNDASIVLRIKFGSGYIILAADAEFASWGKVTEEFPRRQRVTFFQDALGLAEREDTTEQLGCSLLRMAHHGSKHGSSLEYLERLTPSHVVISAGSPAWYDENASNWADMFPHALIRSTLDELDPDLNIRITGEVGNLIYTYTGGAGPSDVQAIEQRPDEPGFAAALAAAWG